MPRKTGRNTKGRIVAAAWKLFYEQGYDNTTVEDIVFASETSKGSFYHYFSGKDDLLGSLSMIFDEKYEELRETLPAYMIPNIFMQVDEMPMTKNGKIDRNALMELYQNRKRGARNG